MKGEFLRNTRLALILAWPCVAGPWVWAQEAPALEIALHTVIRVTGEVGATYVIESRNGVEDDFWLTRGCLGLTTPTAVWTDPVPTDSPRKVYRAVKVTKPMVQTIPNMVWVPPGRFTMGSPETERGREGSSEGPQTRVELTQGFWMGKYEVTQREYLAVTRKNPSYFQPPDFPEDLDRPVERASWDDAVTYCQKLTEQERAAGRIGTNAVYRLPTGAEWEYACWAGTTTRFSFGDALGCGDTCEYCPLLASYMWWCGNGGPGRVGQKLPNPWGLHDMHGNVWEWCQDWGYTYPGGAVVDPQGPSTGWFRVVRGGNNWYDWYGYARDCRSAARYGYGPGADRYGDLGFRAVLAPGQ